MKTTRMWWWERLRARRKDRTMPWQKSPGTQKPELVHLFFVGLSCFLLRVLNRLAMTVHGFQRCDSSGSLLFGQSANTPSPKRSVELLVKSHLNKTILTPKHVLACFTQERNCIIRYAGTQLLWDKLLHCLFGAVIAPVVNKCAYSGGIKVIHFLKPVPGRKRNCCVERWSGNNDQLPKPFCSRKIIKLFY